ncbi:MAG: threonine aldolase [Microgenomates group bacterium Gr01-1014_7]|nr:MAG: threonine aldolase [Microgenomates group bacterium Gr01-1014_7]
MSLEHNFFDDYSEGAHPRILEALNKSNLTQETGYGEDSFSSEAANFIRDRIKNPNAAVHFVSSGTQANLIILASMMKPYEAVIAAKTAHINVHEAGAIEATGHKVISVDSGDGKIKPEQVLQTVKFHTDEHMVKPKVVFISDATELGTVYTKQELEDLSKVCKENGLYLYLDGARLGSALTSGASDITLPEVSNLVDVFYIGGTKNGALLGEAIVINNPGLQEDFRYHLKQKGALLAKGRILGIEFLELFRDDLYFELASHANQMASQLIEGITNLGYKFLVESPTNQIFPILPNRLIERLKERYGFYVWTEVDAENSGIRLVTSWATPEEAVAKFLSYLKSL